MSSGFAGSSTRGLNCLDREIEARLGATNYRPAPEPGVDHSKSRAPFSAPHDDLPAGLSASGNAKDQPGLDAIDKKQQEDDGGIKNTIDQFPNETDDYELGPGKFHQLMEARLRRMSGDNAGFDVHATDPSRLTSGTARGDNPDLYDQRTQEKRMNLTKLNAAVDERMTKLASSDVIDRGDKVEIVHGSDPNHGGQGTVTRVEGNQVWVTFGGGTKPKPFHRSYVKLR